MNYDDDALDRALAALPLEEPPPGLHARIMAATVYRPEPVARSWEIWLIGTLIALAAWLSWLLVSAPDAALRLTYAAANVVDLAGLTSDYTVLWLAIGTSAAWWISQLTFPARPARTEAR
jgi:hypothetical protein